MKRISLSRCFRPFNHIFLALAFFIIPLTIHAQTTEAEQSASAPVDATKSGEALQTRIERARGLIAAHRLETATSELESVRATTRDQSIRNITSILLMSVYLEEGNYSRAEALLEESFQSRSTGKDESLGIYFALSGQAINGARAHLARYRHFGISATNANLPAEVSDDLNRLRSLLDRMIAQAKEVASARRAYDSLSLLEDVLGIRLSLATDSEDQAKWETEYANAREALASSQTQIASLGGIPPLRPAQTNGKISTPSPYSTKKTADNPLEIRTPSQEQASGNAKANSSEGTLTSAAATDSDQQVRQAGLLNALATKRVVPKYPQIAKLSGAYGLVRVYVLVDEAGKVSAIYRSEGPMLLRSAAEDAARKWLFQVASIDGRAARMTGFIDFNFSL